MQTSTILIEALGERNIDNVIALYPSSLQFSLSNSLHTFEVLNIAEEGKGGPRDNSQGEDLIGPAGCQLQPPTCPVFLRLPL